MVQKERKDSLIPGIFLHEKITFKLIMCIYIFLRSIAKQKHSQARKFESLTPTDSPEKIL